MRTCDVEDFKTRSDAVFGSMALDLLGKQIDQHSSSLTDVVSLIEMRGEACTVFEREPMTNVLFNKLLGRKKAVVPSHHGNYVPALEEAARLLSEDHGNATCALMLVFLSDGKPSDHVLAGGSQGTAAGIETKVEDLARQFGSQLTVGTIGFGGAEGDFAVLKGMAAAATAAGAHGSFSYSGKSSSTLSTFVSSLGSRLSATRSRIAGMTSVTGSRRGLTPRPRRQDDGRAGLQASAAPLGGNSSGSISFATFWLYTGNTERWRWAWEGKDIGWIRVPMCAADVNGSGVCSVAVSIGELGRGAERVVYDLQRYTQECPGGPIVHVGEPLVAKESLYAEDDAFNRDFHMVFCKTQQQAAYFARRFNERVSRLCAQRRWLVPATLTFLSCSVYELFGACREEYLVMLVEEKLDRRSWSKWNTNAGHVLGSTERGIDQQQLQEGSYDGSGEANDDDEDAAVPFHLPAIAEGSDSEGEDDQPAPAHHGGGAASTASAAHRLPLLPGDILVADLPQAFSHFTYRDSDRQRLVCDLQGTLDASVSPAVYKLTDPAIHHASRSGRSRVYGRTDHGHTGIRRFFQTHKCNALCKLLGLPSDS